MQVVAAAASGPEAVELFTTHKPDITLMDLQLPVMSGLEAIRAILKADPAAKVIVLTMYQGTEDVYGSLAAGAITFLGKDTLSDELIDTIRAVHAGARPLPPHVQARLAERAQQPSLTDREIEVLDLVARGMRNKELATALGIAEETAHAHMKRIFSKLNVTDRTGAVHVALKRGIIHLS